MEKKPVIHPDGRPWSTYQPPSTAVNQNYPQHNQGYLQLSHMTKPERFPLIFNSAKEFKPDAKRILSFGCSTGEECEAMATRFPDAEVVGIDIDHPTILTARRRNKHPDRVFFHDSLGATGKYDIALALMVFFQMDAPIKYVPWDKCLCDIDAHLNVGGVLMLYTSEFNFSQSSPAENYEVIREWTRQHNRNEKEYFCGYYRKIKDGNKQPAEDEPVELTAVKPVMTPKQTAELANAFEQAAKMQLEQPAPKYEYAYARQRPVRDEKPAPPVAPDDECNVYY